VKSASQASTNKELCSLLFIKDDELHLVHWDDIGRYVGILTPRPIEFQIKSGACRTSLARLGRGRGGFVME
jgi:hypothetical protein